MKTTDVGYINKNNQKNLGYIGISETHVSAKSYEMECLDCGHKYLANGCDIWLRKCPACGITNKRQKNSTINIKRNTRAISDKLRYYDFIDSKTNANPNHVRLYNEFVANPTCEIQAEEPVCCQQLYGILAGCIQEVWTNQDADCAAIMEKANSDFQANYLDNM